MNTKQFEEKARELTLELIGELVLLAKAATKYVQYRASKEARTDALIRDTDLGGFGQ